MTILLINWPRSENNSIGVCVFFPYVWKWPYMEMCNVWIYGVNIRSKIAARYWLDSFIFTCQRLFIIVRFNYLRCTEQTLHITYSNAFRVYIYLSIYIWAQNVNAACVHTTISHIHSHTSRLLYVVFVCSSVWLDLTLSSLAVLLNDWQYVCLSDRLI